MIKKFYVAIAVLFAATTAFQLKTEPSKDILGKWKIDDQYIKTFVNYQIESIRAKSPEQAEQLEQNMDMMVQVVGGLVFDYKADNTLELTTPQGTQTAKWKLSDDNKVHSIIRPDGTERKDPVVELSKDRFKILIGEKKDTLLFVRP